MLFRQVFAVILLTLLAFSGIAFSQQKEQRIALVIGNSAYKVSPLKNPVNDARDMANSLRGYGFTVIERNNLTVKQIGSTLREFRSKLTAGSVALVFYAGHGIQIKGENYLPAVDADIVGEEDVPNQSLSTRQIMDVLADAKSRMNLVFLDACRDNPFARSFRSSSRGLGRENAPSGTLISFATRPGSTAADGDGRNGLYTSVLLEQIKNTGQPIEQVLKRVVTGVKTASKGQQEPWMEGSIEGDFCFGLCGEVSKIISGIQNDESLYKNSRSVETVIYIEGEQVVGKNKTIIKYIKENGVWTQYVNNYIFTTFEETARGFNSISLKDGYRNIQVKFVFDNEFQTASIYFKNNDNNANWALAADQYKVFPRSANNPQPIEQKNINQYTDGKDSEKVFSDVYKMRVANRIKPNIVFLESPKDTLISVVQIKSSIQGQILSSSLVKSSGNDLWDKAILKAIGKTEFLPSAVDGTFPEMLEVSFSTK